MMTGGTWPAHLAEKLVDALAACSDMDDPAFRLQFLAIARERLQAPRALQVSSGGDAQQFIRALVRACQDHKAPAEAVSALRQAMGALRPDTRTAVLLAGCEQAISEVSAAGGDQPGDQASVGSTGARQVPDEMSFDLGELRRAAELALRAAGSDQMGAGGSHADVAFDYVEVRAATVTFSGSVRAGQRRIVVRVYSRVAQAFERTSFHDAVQRAREVSAHPSIARLLDADFTALSYPFIIQVADNPVTRYGPALAGVQVVDIGSKLADAFFYAHNHGIVLGRIGLPDLLLTADGEPVLVLPHLPIATTRGTAAAGAQQDVHGLCQTLLSMLTDSPQADLAERVLAGRARDILRAGMHEQPLLRPSAMVLRDQLNALKRDIMQSPDDLNISVRFTVRRKPGSRTDIILTAGDLFSERADLVIGFSDTFDTAPDGVVISPSSLQGQLVKRLYGDDAAELDRDLDRALELVPDPMVEDRSRKARGKLKRYPVGTVASWEHGGRRIYAVAVSHMGNDLIAQSSYAFLDRSLNRLWQQIRSDHPSRPVAMPIIGSGLSRMDMSRNFLLQEIISSFTAETQKEPICRELRIVVHPSDLKSVDLATVTAFTRGLSSAQP